MRALSFLAVAALAVACTPRDPSTAERPVRPILVDLLAPLRDRPHGKVIGWSRCGMHHEIVARAGDSSRLVQVPEPGARWEEGPDPPGFVAEGWVDDADVDAVARAPEEGVRCIGPMLLTNGRAPYAAIRALTPPSLVEIDHDAHLARLPETIWRVVEDGPRKACLASRIDERENAIVEGQGLPGPHTVTAWGLRHDEEDPRVLVLTGPTITAVDARGAPTKEPIGWLCLHEVYVARRTKDALVVVPHPRERASLWAYPPTMTEWWYTSREACERELPPTRRTIAQGTPQRRDCF